MGEKITPACTSEKGSAERRRNAFSRALMKGVGRNTRGPASEGSPWGAHRGGCTVGHSSGPQRGRWSRALASGARVVSVWYQGGTTLLPGRYQAGTRLVPIWYLVPGWYQAGTRLVPGTRLVRGWYQSGTSLVPVWYQSGTRLVPDHKVPLHFPYMSPVPEPRSLPKSGLKVADPGA